jgi:hypothetical protein
VQEARRELYAGPDGARAQADPVWNGARAQADAVWNGARGGTLV